MQAPPKLVVFSDLDGTLLDHDTYAWDAAAPALERLARLGCPVILTSSKTAVEIRVLQEAMELTGLPAIVENGAGVIGLPDQPTTGEQYTKLRAVLDGIDANLRARFTGFGDMNADDIVAATGLSQGAAALARQRDFSEPGLFSGNDAEREAFLVAVRKNGLHVTQGGRFLTLSFGATKADGMERVMAHYRPDHSVALGDAPNDITMLEAAEFGVIVANSHRDPLPTLRGEAAGRISRTSDTGPEGWNTAICALLDRLDLN